MPLANNGNKHSFARGTETPYRWMSFFLKVEHIPVERKGFYAGFKGAIEKNSFSRDNNFIIISLVALGSAESPVALGSALIYGLI